MTPHSCLPLGSFTWRVRTNSNAREALASYEVQVVSGAVPQKAVFVHETETPVMYTGASLSSPLLGVHRQYMVWQEAVAQVAVTGEWNRVKHLAVTERIDVKDQTTSGIQLLDEQRRCVPSFCSPAPHVRVIVADTHRRYNLTGEHNSVLHNNLMRLKGVGTTTSVSHAFHHAVHSQFEDAPAGEPRVGSKRAAVHMLLTNTDVVELSAMDPGNAIQEAKVEFQEAVYTFFSLPNINKSREEAARRGSTVLHREQYSNIMYMQTVLERLGEAAYAQCFGARKVRFALRALPRFEITSVDDIKVLCEIDMLTTEDKAHLRRMIMNRQ